MKTRIILVGGFLGAGKTTLLREAARQLKAQDKKISLITNDQADGLVDTGFLEIENDSVLEVSGSCFCCNFNGLIGALEKARTDGQAELIIAEPVGSCTDLSATIIQPLKEKYGAEFELAPLTVLMDPQKLSSLLAGRNAGLHESSAYILKKQLEEADLIVINKIDQLENAALDELLLKTAARYQQAQILTMSALNGETLAPWLDTVLNAKGAGQRLAEVDYDIYAQGEAVLGWLNATMTVSAAGADWNQVGQTLLNSLGQRFEKAQAAVGHVKLLLETKNQSLIGNLTGPLETLKMRGHIKTADQVELIINARVEMSPEQLETIVREEVAAVLTDGLTASKLVLKSLSPGRPTPTYRYRQVI